MKVLANVDGGGAYGARQAGIGVVLTNRDTGEIILAKGYPIGVATNNEAEYSAVIQALLHAQEFGATDILVQSDSKLIVNQTNGDWIVHENHLKFYWDETIREASHFPSFKIEWIPRSENKAADKLAREAVT